MKEILYLEIPTPETESVCTWLQETWQPSQGEKILTGDGILLKSPSNTTAQSQSIPETELSIFLWSLQRTTYLKVFRWGEQAFPQEGKICRQLQQDLNRYFPHHYPSINYSLSH